MKRLFRSRTDRMISGVLGGLASYLQMDPTVVRLLYVILTLVTGIWFGLIAYIAAMFVIPLE